MRQHHAAFPWSTAVVVRPILPAVTAGESQESLQDAAPDLQMELPPPSSMAFAHSTPPRPRVPVSTVTPAEIEHKADAIEIAPQLSAEEVESAKQQADNSLRAATKNLDSMKGKQLNAAQLDLLSKIRGFINDAKEASRLQDWIRARNAAKKAQVLSEQLVGSI